MPMIELTVPEGTLSTQDADRLLDDLSSCLRRWEQAPDTTFFRQITWAYLHEVTPQRVRVDGTAAPRYRVEVTVPDGVFSQRRKDGLIAEVHELIATAVGLDPEQALQVWTLIREVPDGNWGAGGRTVHYEQLKALAAGQRADATASRA